LSIRFREKKAKREAITLRLGSLGLLPTGPIRAFVDALFFVHVLGKLEKRSACLYHRWNLLHPPTATLTIANTGIVSNCYTQRGGIRIEREEREE
jgi:hypothetical protein